MKVPYALAFALLMLNPLFVSAAAPTQIDVTACEPAAPVIPVADLNADGVVNRKDFGIMKHYNKKVYSALLDRNHDFIVDFDDVASVIEDLGKTTTPEQQALALDSYILITGAKDCIPSNVVLDPDY